MKKYRYLFLWIGVMGLLAAGFFWAKPVSAFTNIEFNFTDNVTNQPWGTVDGQGYRIVVYNLTTSTLLLDTGMIYTPAANPLSFTCAFGSTCAGSALGTAADYNQILVSVELDGSVGNPTTYQTTFLNTPGTAFTMNEKTGTGPTAVALSSFSATPVPFQQLAWVLLLAAFLASTTFVVWRKNNAQHLLNL